LFECYNSGRLTYTGRIDDAPPASKSDLENIYYKRKR